MTAQAARPIATALAKWGALNGLLVLAYVAAAQAGMAATLAGSQVSLIWPPAGLMLAALLLWGPAVLPGLLLAAMAVNWGLWVGELGSAAWLTAASVAQAGIAAWALRKVPQQMAAAPTRQSLRFGLVVLLACMLAPSVGCEVLRGLGRLDDAELPYTWLTWWAGDSAGMLVLAPLLLLLRHPALRSERLPKLTFPILCLGLGLSLISSMIVGHLERERQIEQFKASGQALGVALQHRLDLTQRDLEQLRYAYYKVQISRQEFHALTAPLLQRDAWLDGFEWLPRQGQPMPGFVEPAPGSEPALEAEGRTAQSPELAPLLEASTRTGHLMASAPMMGREPGEVLVRLVVPVLDPGVAGMGPHQPAHVRGLVSTEINLGRWLADDNSPIPLAGLHLEALDIRLADPQARKLTSLVGISRENGQLAPLMHEELAEPRGISHKLIVWAADRPWELVLRPRLPMSWWWPSWLQAGMFLGGLSFTMLLAAYLISRHRADDLLAQGRALLAYQVADRTRALTEANLKLGLEIQERRQLEAELRQASHRAESANRAKSMFLANMSHEIRTPLNAVIGYAQLLGEERGLAASSRERALAILAAGRRLLRLINDVLDLSKIESGHLSLQAERFDLAHEAEELARLLEQRIAAKGLRFDLRLALPEPCWVRGDRGKLGQIVLNLMGNALKFTEQGQIGLSAAYDGMTLWVEVADSGPGMSAAELAELFVPFQQGQAGAQRGGTGLGLALSRRLAQHMGGQLSLQSSPGHGCTATLRLPLPQEVPAPLPNADAAVSPSAVPLGATAAEQPNPARRTQASVDQSAAPSAALPRLDLATPCRALVVEDDPDSRAVLSQALRRLGCEVQETVDGRAGSEAAERQPPDIVFTDIRMPQMDGVALLHRLRGQAPLAGVPVVAVSASSLVHERRYYIEQGFQDFVSKPYELDEISRMLSLHAGARWQAPEPVEEAALQAASAASPEQEAAASAPGLATPLLRALASAAREGEVQAVRQALQTLAGGMLPPRECQRLETLARQYDFAALAEQADALAAPHEQREPR